MDESQPEIEPSRFLSGERRLCVYYMFLYGLHRTRRFSGIEDIPNSTIACKGHELLVMSSDIASHCVAIVDRKGVRECVCVAHSSVSLRGWCLLKLTVTAIFVWPDNEILSPVHRDCQPVPNSAFTCCHESRALTFTTTWIAVLPDHFFPQVFF